MNKNVQVPLFISMMTLFLSGCGGSESSEIVSQSPEETIIPLNYSIQIFERSADTEHMCNAIPY